MLLEELSNIADNLGMMPDTALQKFAAMHKDDPYIMALAVSESNRRKKMRAAQSPQVAPQPTVADAEIAEMSGIAALPAPNMETMSAAVGGIVGNDYDMAVGYADGGMVERYQSGGNTRDLFEKALDAEGVTNPRERAFLRSIHMQESGGKATAKTSNRGAVGAMQILPATFSSVADKGMNINDPLDNMRAGIRYGRQGFQASGGDPVLAGAYYYGGPGGMAKAAKGEAVADPKNPNAPTTIDYGKQVAARMTSLLPISTAQAAQPSAPAADREKLISQIPGQTAAGRTTAPEPERRPQDYLFGAGETGLAMLTGALSPVTGGGRKVLQEVLYGKSDPMEKQMAEMTFAPRGEAGQAMTQGLARVAQDLKIPAYIPAMGPAAPSLSRTPRTAELVGKADDAAARVAEEQARLAALVGPPSSAQTPGQARAAATTLAQREGAAGQAARASGMAQQEAAAGRVAAERIGQEAAYTQGAGQRANVAALGATGSQVAAGAEVPPDTGEQPFVPMPGDDSYDRAEKNKFIRQQMEKLDMDVSKKDLVAAAKEVAPEAGKKGWTGEDWLLLGLGMMGSKNPNFLGALGEAGAGVIKEKRAQAKEEREDVYRRALAREATAKAKVYESGTGDVAKATAYADKAFDNWLNGLKANPMFPMMNVTPEQIEAQRQKYLREAYAMYKIPLPEGFGTGVASAGGFKVLGSRPG